MRGGTVEFDGGVAGNDWGGPSVRYRSLNCAGVKAPPRPLGSSPPATAPNLPVATRAASARARIAGCCHAEVGRRNTTLVGFDSAVAKYAVSAA